MRTGQILKRWRTIVIMGILSAAALTVGVAFAQAFIDHQEAQGSVNFLTTTVSPDLYICEPGEVSGPECGLDDSGADEIVFEGREDVIERANIWWDVRLKNVGQEDWVLGNVSLEISEANDPDGGCIDGILELGQSRSLNNNANPGGMVIVGKEGDSENDNSKLNFDSSVPLFAREGEGETPGSSLKRLPIIVAAGDYEDVTLALKMSGLNYANSIACIGNEWNVTWKIETWPILDLDGDD